MYSFEMDRPELDLDANGKIQKHQKAKGISKSVVKRAIRHEHYIQCLDNYIGDRVSITSMRSFNHEVYVFEQTKVGLCAIDDKRYILEDGRQTYAYGHYRIKPVEQIPHSK